MVLDNIMNAIVEGDIETLLLYFPIFVIGIGLLILIAVSLKDRLKGMSGWLPNLEGMTLPRFKLKRTKEEPKEEAEKGIDYQKEVKWVLEEKDPTKAMEKLSILINQYFSQLLDLHHAFTYEEAIQKLEKGGKTKLKQFCERLLHIQFSKDIVSREELEQIASEFLNVIKQHPLKKLETEKVVKKKKRFVRLKRFKKELQREWARGKNLEEKLDNMIRRTGKAMWDFVKDHFSSTRIPKTVSFDAVLKDIKKHEKKKSFMEMFEEDRPTVEGVFYFIYLIFRKKFLESKKIKKIEEIIKKGEDNLSKRRDVIQAQATYNTIFPIYKALSTQNQKKVLPKIALFYEDINNCMNFQKALMCLFQLELAMKTKEIAKAKQSYLEVSKLYEKMPPMYKNRIYERFLNLEKEFNTSIAENEGGKKNA